MDRPKLSILMPAYNEEDTIAEMVGRVLALAIEPKELIIVDDGSTDATARLAREIAERDPRVRFEQLPHNQGKTAAIARALELAIGQVIMVQDADLEYDPADIPSVVAPIFSGEADVVYGSRFLVRKAARVLYFYHYLANRSLTFLSNLFTNRNMTDIETCYKAFRAEVIKPLRLTSSGFGMEVEITAMICKTRARTFEVPISYYGRTYEEGKKISSIDGVMAIYYIFYYNLIKARSAATREYVARVDQALTPRPRPIRDVEPDSLGQDGRELSAGEAHSVTNGERASRIHKVE